MDKWRKQGFILTLYPGCCHHALTAPYWKYKIQNIKKNYRNGYIIYNNTKDYFLHDLASQFDGSSVRVLSENFSHSSGCVDSAFKWELSLFFLHGYKSFPTQTQIFFYTDKNLFLHRYKSDEITVLSDF